MFVPLLQLDLAMGLMYLGFQTARYRSRLHDRIVETFNAVPDREIDIDSYKQSVFDVPGLYKKHQVVVTWVKTLSQTQRLRLTSKVSEFYRSRAELAEAPPCMYQWFQKNVDLWWVGITSVAAPIAAFWAMGQCGYPPEFPAWASWAAIAVGQISVVVHVLVGRWIIADRYHTKFFDALTALMRHLDSTATSSEMRQLGSQGAERAQRPGSVVGPSSSS